MRRIATVAVTNEILQTYDLYAKKKYGQNFIIDPQIITKIVTYANINQDTTVIEVGPGIGALSQGLCEVANKVIAYEIDEDMVNVLHHEFKDVENFTVNHLDFLTVQLDEVFNGLDNVKVVANLPYYITS